MPYLYTLQKKRYGVESPGRLSRPSSGESTYSVSSTKSEVDRKTYLKNRGKRWATTSETRHAVTESDGRSRSRQSTSNSLVRASSTSSLAMQDSAWKRMTELFGSRKEQRDKEIFRIYVRSTQRHKSTPETCDNKTTKPRNTIWWNNQELSQKNADVYKDISVLYGSSISREKRRNSFLEKYAEKQAELLKEKSKDRYKDECRRYDKKRQVHDQVRNNRLQFSTEMKYRSKAQYVTTRELQHEKSEPKLKTHFALPDNISKDTKPKTFRRPKLPDLNVNKEKLMKIGRRSHLSFFDPYSLQKGGQNGIGQKPTTTTSRTSSLTGLSQGTDQGKIIPRSRTNPYNSSFYHMIFPFIKPFHKFSNMTHVT